MHTRVNEQKLRVMLEQRSDAEKERGWRGAEDERGEEERSREKEEVPSLAL